jgi:predicted RNA-binding protein Jag
MKAAERRIVHLALADVEGVSTYTMGNGDMRKVFVSTGRGDQGPNRQRNR